MKQNNTTRLTMIDAAKTVLKKIAALSLLVFAGILTVIGIKIALQLATEYDRFSVMSIILKSIVITTLFGFAVLISQRIADDDEQQAK